MPSRRELVERIQTLSAAEREWQPTAREWLKEQDMARKLSKTGRRGVHSPGSPAQTPEPKPGTNPDGRTPVALPTDTSKRTEMPKAAKR